MTKRATFTQSELARAIRAAQSLGKVALWTPAGIAFVESQELPIALPSGDLGDQAECDRLFGVGP
jgi:hypothetical protein